MMMGRIGSQFGRFIISERSDFIIEDVAMNELTQVAADLTLFGR